MEWLRGGCHCGAVLFDVMQPREGRLVVQDCNCSICTKKGFLHLIVSKSAFRLYAPTESAEAAEGDVLGSYRFGTRVANHFFCRRCGICSFYVPRSNPDGYSVNARCLERFPQLQEEGRFHVELFDGRGNWEGDAAKVAHLSK